MLKEQYIPEALNEIFAKTSKRILNVYALLRDTLKCDSQMAVEQLHIVLEKFARKVIIGIVNSDTKFAAFHRIKKAVQITKPLFFIVTIHSTH